MRCRDCKKLVEDSLWDKFRKFFFNRFKNDIEDIRAELYTKGIGEGYKLGFMHAEERGKETLKEFVHISTLNETSQTKNP